VSAEVWAALTAGAVAALLASEWRDFRPGVWVAKPAASTGFLLVALASGAAGSAYGRWVLAALAFSWLGDVLLIPKGARSAFLAGLVAFLLGHLLFAVAFSSLGLDGSWLGAATLLVLGAAAAALRWLMPHVEGGMVWPVRAYVVVISAMVVAAAGATGHTGVGLVLAGALLFYVSDLAVARERFVAKTFTNKLWGLPTYYGGQVLLALSVAAAG
jgi:uncharacterized membrane protein YhhN